MFNHVKAPVLSPLRKIENEKGRFYESPLGLYYPSITTILGATGDKTYLEQWKKNIGEDNAERLRRSAANRGTRIHKFAEDHLNNIPIERSCLTPIDKVNLDLILPFLNEKIDNIRHQECHVYSDYLKIAGQLDCVADFDGKLSIIDFKTSTKVKYKDMIEDYFLQATFYSLAYEEMTSISIKDIVIIMFVDFDRPVFFKEKRNKYISALIERRKSYA